MSVNSGLRRVAGLIATHQKTKNRIVNFLELFRGDKRLTAADIKEALGVDQKVFEKDVGRLKEIGLLHGERTNGNYHYYLSYEAFNTWLKTVRDPVYNLLKR